MISTSHQQSGRVLILNLKKTFIDGFSIIEQLRSHSRGQHELAILVVSGYSLSTDKQRAYRLGADAYLTKPMLPIELSETVAELMSLERVQLSGPQLSCPVEKPLLENALRK